MFDTHFMKEALALAEQSAQLGFVPVGAVVVCEGGVIARAHNDCEGVTLPRPWLHAELIAAAEACRCLGVERLPLCDVFVTLEPCPMCAEALRLLRLRKLVFGAYDPTNGFLSRRGGQWAAGSWELIGGVCEQDCRRLLRSYFQERRSRANEISVYSDLLRP